MSDCDIGSQFWYLDVVEPSKSRCKGVATRLSLGRLCRRCIFMGLPGVSLGGADSPPQFSEWANFFVQATVRLF
jgi:hypothetical protein